MCRTAGTETHVLLRSGKYARVAAGFSNLVHGQANALVLEEIH